MGKILLVGMGGFVGSVMRFLLGGWVYRFSNEHWFPFGTIAVNGIGCLAIGILAGYFEAHRVADDQLKLFLFTGILGGFTTFSAFSLESLQLFRSTEYAAFVMNISAHFVICILGAGLGFAWGRLI